MKHFTVVVASLALAACGVESSTTITPPSTPAPAPASAAPSASTAASTAAPKPDAPAGSAHKSGAPLEFSPPADWVVETVTSSVRLAQYKLPKVGSDGEDAELVVYHFGSMGGGSVEANLERWCTQFQQPDGRKSSEVLTKSTRQVAGLDVTEAKLSGTYVAETTPGSGVRVNKADFEMLAAILPTDQGDYYVKLVGPTATVEHHAAAFRDFISRVK